MGCCHTNKEMIKIDRKNYDNTLNDKTKTNDTKNDVLKITDSNEYKFFIEESLKRHNELRKLHLSPPLEHNIELSEIAQKFADYLAFNDVFKHSECKWGTKFIGENIAMGFKSGLTAIQMVDMFYDEIKDYDFNNPGFSMKTGHFTQVVWKDSKEVGFGYAFSKNGNWYGVVNYFPAGNYQGMFEVNVYPK